MSTFIQQLINGVSWGSIYALIALGYTMVYGIVRLINFAQGDIYMIGAMAGYYLALFLGTTMGSGSIFFILPASMMICGLLGFVIEKLAYKPVRNAPRITALITAIGVSLFLEYGGQLVFGADPKFFPELVTSKPLFYMGGAVINNIQAIILVTSLLLMALLNLIVMKTKMGKAMRAVSFSHTASALVGINVNRVISFTFILGGALAGAAGVLVSLSNPKIEPLMGIMPGIKAFVAAVLGGIGSIPGALVGGLILGVSETMVTAYISSTYRDALAFIILILILLIKPTGLFGKKSQEKV
ncbi:MAG: branched-chain amino acid ABC transporter permease [Deltaproteobacteria bacterium]|nr:branched-chain amino acid ABC transporter permease [Deltaproteobacteria bacterium]